MEVKVVVVVVVTVTVTVTVVTVTVTVVTISFWRGGSRPPPIKVKSKVTHFGGAFSTFSPFSDRTDSAAPLQRKISVSNAPFWWLLPHPLLPTVVRKIFTQLFGRFPTFPFSRTTIFFRKSEF